mmetsp:Transcript_49746/g.160863  ORF Transcript_49746/g.160863 Transcript_49746/m.160863 type:complete len:137 (-) Transcript_49746:115-525(-)
MRADGPARGHSRGSSALDNLVTAAREDKGEHLRLVALAGEVQRRHPILVGDPELEARLFAREHLGRLHVPAGDRDVQRRLPILTSSSGAPASTSTSRISTWRSSAAMCSRPASGLPLASASLKPATSPLRASAAAA